MAFVIDDAFLPVTLTAPPMTDEEFAEFCAEHPDLFFEMTAEGELIATPPTDSDTGTSNADITAQLRAWSKRNGRGVVSDSSTGFVLPNGARRSPDACWTLSGRVRQLDPASRNGFWHLSPDFVIELQSAIDRPRLVREKMHEWVANRAQLCWPIDPSRKSAFVLDLTSVWVPRGT